MYLILNVPNPITAPQKICPITCSYVTLLTTNGFPITNVCSLDGNNPPIIENPNEIVAKIIEFFKMNLK